MPSPNRPPLYNRVTEALYRHRILLSLIMFAFLLRIWGIWNADSTDEYNEVFEALRVCSGHLNYERWFKRFYLYILSCEYGGYYGLGRLFHQFSSPSDFAAKIIRDLTPLFLIGRITSAVMGTISIFMTYRIGSSLYNKNVGLVAALFLCFNVVNIELSHYARVDATLCAVVLISFYFIVKIFQGGNLQSLKYYALAGLFMGIAFQNKIPSVILFVPFMFAHLATAELKLSSSTVLNRKTACFAVLFLVGIIIGNPAIVLAPLKFVNGMISTGAAFTTPINETKSHYIGYLEYLFYFYKELGLPLTLLAVFSVWNAVVSKSREDILLLSFIVPFYGLMGASRYMVGYSYMIPLMPFLYILCSRYLFEGIGRLEQSISQKVLIVGMALLLIMPIMNVSKLIASFSAGNTRYLAKIWIEANIPFGSRILMDSGKTINSTAPLIAQNRESLLQSMESIEESLERGTLADSTKMVDKNAVTYYKMLLETVPRESYYLTSTKFGLDLKSIDYYREKGYQYFVISENMKQSRTDEYFTQRYPQVAKFYSSLDTDSRIRLIQVIAPSVISSGDTFYIYQVL